MRWRVIGLMSLGVNGLLLAAWLFVPRPSGGRADVPSSAFGQNSNGLSRSNIIVRRQFFSWREVESDDYPTYIANLRQIGCPEQTIRDIIIADVNALYARRRANEIVSPQQQWWRSEPDPVVRKAAEQKSNELEEERKNLLTRLLGPNWESGDLVSLPRPTQPGIALDGPVLGSLPMETKQALEDINARSQQRMQAYIEAQRKAGKAPDPAELARLRQQTRTELAGILAPAQLEEFLLRYSQYANNLRAEFGQLQYFNPTPDEFRNIFRATDALDQQIEMLADATDAASVQTRKNLMEQREAALMQVMGPKRYEQYQLLHDPLYRQAVASAIAAGTPDAAQTYYAINLATAAQQQSILSDTNLTTEQKNIALKSAELDQLKADAALSGQELPPEPPLPPSFPPRRTYTLQPGDTPSVVAMIYGIPEAALRAANPNVNFSRLRPGDSIVIPRNAPNPVGAPRMTPNGP